MSGCLHIVHAGFKIEKAVGLKDDMFMVQFKLVKEMDKVPEKGLCFFEKK